MTEEKVLDENSEKEEDELVFSPDFNPQLINFGGGLMETYIRKLKLMEATNDIPFDDVQALAWDITEILHDDDPYEFNDIFDSFEEAVSTVEVDVSLNPGEVIDQLETFYEKHEEEDAWFGDIKSRVEDALDRLKTYQAQLADEE